MNLTRYQHPLSTDGFDRLFDWSAPGFGRLHSLFNEVLQASEANRQLPVDLHEDTEGYTVEAELPGFSRDQISLKVENNVLSLKASNACEGNECERSRSLERAIYLPEHVEQEAIRAELKDGLLSIRLPKAAASQPRRIDVN